MVPERHLTESAAERQAPSAAVRRQPQLRTFYLRWGVTVFVGLLAVSRFAAAAQVGYAIDRTQAQLQVARAQELALESQVSALTSAGHLAAIAAKLNLAPAPAVLSLTVPQGGPAGRPSGEAGAHRGILADVGALIQSITRAVIGM